MNKSATAESQLMPIRVPTTVDNINAETDVDVVKKNSYKYYHPFHRISSKCFRTHTISVKIKQKINRKKVVSEFNRIVGRFEICMYNAKQI